MAITTTPRLGLHIWSAGTDQFTRVQLNGDHQVLEAKVAMFEQGLLVDRPVAGKTGRLYFATDNDIQYYDNGVSWKTTGATQFFPLAGGTLTGALAVGTSVTVTGGSVLTTTGLTTGVGDTSAALVAGAGTHTLDIGRKDGTSSSPVINLHSSGSNTAYDSRIVASGGSGTVGQGILTITASGGVSINGGTAWHSNNDGNGSGLDADTIGGIANAALVTLTGSQTLTNKTLTTPFIASFANALHDHSNAANGGAISPSVIIGTAVIDSDYRLSNTRTPTNGSIVDAMIATTLSPTKITGTAVVTADTRLSDARTPTVGSIVDSMISSTLSPAKITGTAVVTADARLSNTRTPSAGSIVDAMISSTLSPTKITGTAVVNADARLSDVRTPAPGSIVDAMISATLSPDKITGTAVVTADARLSNTRTPSAGSIVDAMISSTLSPDRITGTAVITTDARLSAVARVIDPPRCQLKANSVAGVANEMYVVVNWDVEVVDTDSMRSPGSPTRIYFTTAGTYEIDAMVTWAASSGLTGARIIAVERNSTGTSGTGTILAVPASQAPTTLASTAVVRLTATFAAGQWIEVFRWQSSSGTLEPSGAGAFGNSITVRMVA